MSEFPFRSPQDEAAQKARAYQKAYRTRTKKITLTIPTAQYDELLALAQRHHRKSVGPFLLECTQAYFDHTYVIPSPEKLEQLIFQIGMIGNNLNQLTHLAHLRGSVEVKDLQEVHDFVQKLKKAVGEYVQRPRDIETLVKEALERPGFVEFLHKTLRER